MTKQVGKSIQAEITNTDSNARLAHHFVISQDAAARFSYECNSRGIRRDLSRNMTKQGGKCIQAEIPNTDSNARLAHHFVISQDAAARFYHRSY